MGCRKVGVGEGVEGLYGGRALERANHKRGFRLCPCTFESLPSPLSELVLFLLRILESLLEQSLSISIPSQ